MRTKRAFWASAAGFLVLAPFGGNAVSAQGIDGTKNTICAVTEVVGCTDLGACLQGRATSFDLPDFIIFDAEDNVLRSAYESGDKSVSPVKHSELNGKHFVLHGVENSRGWDVAIHTETGKMRAALVGDALSFLAFGACTTP